MSSAVNSTRRPHITVGQKVDAENLLKEKAWACTQFKKVYSQCVKKQKALSHFQQLLQERVAELDKGCLKGNEKEEYQQYVEKLSAFRENISQADDYSGELQKLIAKVKSFMDKQCGKDVQAITACKKEIDSLYLKMKDQSDECELFLKVFKRCLEVKENRYPMKKRIEQSASGSLKSINLLGEGYTATFDGQKKVTHYLLLPSVITHFSAGSHSFLSPPSGSPTPISPSSPRTPIRTPLATIAEQLSSSSFETEIFEG